MIFFLCQIYVNTFLLGWLNKTKIHNRHEIINLLDNRPKNVPLITVSNHHSCFDDPGLWGEKIN